MRRLEEMFWPTKTQAIKRIGVLMALAIGVPLFCGHDAGGFFWLFAFFAVWPAIVLYLRFAKDRSDGIKAVEHRYVAAEHYEASAQRTTSGNRFFVPGQPTDRPESM